MAFALRNCLSQLPKNLGFVSQVRFMSGEWGSGSGRGGGGGGSVRDAGGSFGKMEAAHEEQYFRKMQQEQLKAIQASLHEEIEFSEKQISELQEEIARHKKKLSKLKDLKKDH